MRQGETKDAHIDEIKNKYLKIDKDWLEFHYKLSIGLVLVAIFVEYFLGIILANTDMMSITVAKYLWKYLIVPSCITFIGIGIDSIVMKAKRFTQNQKIYVISIVFVLLCFVLYTVHSAFISVSFIFLIAIMLTTIYANYQVTSVTAALSIFSFVVSERFTLWDPDRETIFESTVRMGSFVVAIVTMASFFALCIIVIYYERKKNIASIQIELERHHLQQRLQVDEMTGIYNRRALLNILKDMETDSTDDHYILAMVDVDNFKRINDTWGHSVGDICLIQFARILKEMQDKTGCTPFRYAGDEFCLLFHNITMHEAIEICKQIQLQLQKLEFKEQSGLKLTASFGLAAYSGRIDTGKLFINADYALYEAKAVRNTIRTYEE